MSLFDWLKEITYKHCEGYAAGELKHGPLALVEKNIPIIVVAPFNENFSKIISNIQEIKARGGKIILITDSLGLKKAKKFCDQHILMPKTNFLSDTESCSNSFAKSFSYFFKVL